ncbi:hypothetical protein Nizo2889_1958 [Lactiplantibacillus plantarum]|nr:hypothetical protein Nizo2889_1958 [Lactiplantibacillus plantarum]
MNIVWMLLPAIAWGVLPLIVSQLGGHQLIKFLVRPLEH